MEILKGLGTVDRLHEIGVKALTVGSRYAEMDPNDMQKMSTLMQNCSYAYCPNGSHMRMRDIRAVYFMQLLALLRTV
jgi:proline iminopeptidase